MEVGMIKVDGMTCNNCVETVTNTLKSINGVDNVNVSLEKAQASVSFDEEVTSLAILKKAIENAGFEIPKPVHGEDGNCCGGCGGQAH